MKKYYPIILIVVLLLSGCGQSGPLYLPPAPSQKAQAQKQNHHAPASSQPKKNVNTP